MASRPVRALAAVQGTYYIATGLWPILDLASFYAVTGPKTDDWLVQTVGALVIAVGLALLVAAARSQVPIPVRTLGAASAVAFIAVEVIFFVQGLLRVVYLGDAFLHALFLGAWAVTWPHPSRTSRGSST